MIKTIRDNDKTNSNIIQETPKATFVATKTTATKSYSQVLVPRSVELQNRNVSNPPVINNANIPQQNNNSNANSKIVPQDALDRLLKLAETLERIQKTCEALKINFSDFGEKFGLNLISGLSAGNNQAPSSL